MPQVCQEVVKIHHRWEAWVLKVGEIIGGRRGHLVPDVRRTPAHVQGHILRLDAWPATPAATAKEGGGGRGAALTIPVIEKYIANAGSIVGAAKNPTYIRLRDTIQQIVRSKKYLMNILKSITFYTIDNYIASFEESIDHLYRDLPVLDPEVQDGIDRILDPMVSEALHTFEMGNRLTLEPARLVALQNFATHSTLKETAAAVNLLPGLLAVYDATVTGQAPEDALRLLSGLQNQLSQTLIPGKLKKRFLSYLQKLKNNNNDQLRQKEVQAWRLEAEGFKPATEEQLEAGQRPGTAHGPTGNPWQPPSGSGASARPCGVFPKEPWP